ncbi:MAG: hypothetical protein AMXMBFR36_31880 [Acidobacteriota bacterium]
MVSSVLRSERAVRANIEILRAFVRWRRIPATHVELALELDVLDELERRYDARFREVSAALRALIASEASPPRPIGVGDRRVRGGAPKLPRPARREPSRRLDVKTS